MDVVCRYEVDGWRVASSRKMAMRLLAVYNDIGMVGVNSRENKSSLALSRLLFARSLPSSLSW